MYIAYRIETCDGIDYMQPVGVFRNKKDMNDFKSISPSNLNFEKVPMIDIRKISPIKYMKYWYSKDGSCGHSCGVTNSLFVKDVEKYNKVYVINGYLKITKVLKDGEDYASGALYMGASPKEAVKAACELCAFVCEPIVCESISR